MATDIKIVIRGSDEFSSAFEALDNALGGIGQAGDVAVGALTGLEGALAGVAAGTRSAGQLASAFADSLGEDFATIMETQQAALEELALQQESSTVELGERLLEIDAEFLERRNAQREQANAQMQREHAALQEALKKAQLKVQLEIAQEEGQILDARAERFRNFFAALSELAASHGRSLAALAKALGVAQALVDTYRAVNNALASVPYPFNLAAAAVVLNRGLANVQRIRQVGVAHAGLEFVPREQTFLLDRGERVLSASQNRDLTTFLASGQSPGGSRGVVIENVTIHILENATTGDALLELDQEEMRQLVAERIVPTLDELARLGIRPEFDGSIS